MVRRIRGEGETTNVNETALDREWQRWNAVCFATTYKVGKEEEEEEVVQIRGSYRGCPHFKFRLGQVCFSPVLLFVHLFRCLLYLIVVN